MTGTRWVPTPPDRRESVLSGLLGAAVGIGAGLATWYVARTLMAREPVVRSGGRDPAPPERRIEPGLRPAAVSRERGVVSARRPADGTGGRDALPPRRSADGSATG